MKKLAMLFAIVATTTMATEPVNKTINDVLVTVDDNAVIVTLDNKHIFSQDCKDYTCKLFVPLVPDPYIEREDGSIIESPVIKLVSIKNMPSFRRFGDSIVFIVNKTSVSGLYSRIEHYTVNTRTGSVSVNINESDVYAHGMPGPKNKVTNTNLDYSTTVTL